jgi:hypothetical protein
MLSAPPIKPARPGSPGACADELKAMQAACRDFLLAQVCITQNILHTK